ncbi:MAG TPA: diacylglycerol kinase family lipid kinase [Candidatus Hydrogenedentes bacterium]|nr:diacylglycerol kinase family lipid kinase [Candidatus Hydrogenedentota bacterium]
MGHAAKYAVIVNPASGNRRTGKAWSELEKEIQKVLGEFTTLFTQRPGHATELARNALRDGHNRIVGVGGDGTYHEIVNGFFEDDAPVNPDAALAILPRGTGSDLARTLGLPRGDDAIPFLSADAVITSDVGRARFMCADGHEQTAYFLNVAHVGMGGAVVRRVNNTTKVFGGFASYFWGVMATLMTYRNLRMQLDIDGTHIDQRCRDVIIANGCYDGGGMHVAPQARLDNGTFEVFVIGDAGRFESIRHIPNLYRGTLTRYAHRVQYFRAKRVVIQADEPALLTLEGEHPGHTPITIDILPATIRLVKPQAGQS